ncbi:hypothetical protein K438DRAFT_1754237 [Mycena galopus ATCC 62051]|nr:hypothetical protein K438DRAFT_1754237 [Mycena galopus ATCC 62051]
MKFLTFGSAALATLAAASALSVNTQGNLLQPLLNNIEETLAALLGYPSLKPVGSVLSSMHTMVKALPSLEATEGAKGMSSASASNDSRANGDLLPLLNNIEETLATLLGYPSLKPVGSILANMHTMVKALPSLAGGGSLGLGGNQTGATRT